MASSIFLNCERPDKYSDISAHKQRLGLSSIIFFLVFISGCITIDGVEQPSEVQAGKTFNTTVHLKIQCQKALNNAHLIFGLLVPKAWNSPKNGEAMYSSNIGSGKMIRVSTHQIAPGSKFNWSKALFYQIGTGKNKINDMEWLVFSTDKVFNLKKNQPDILGEIHLQTNVGDQNMKVSLGYFLGDDVDGFQNEHSATVVYFGNPLQVTSSALPNIDFLQLHQVIVTPINAAYSNCPLTVIFDGNMNKTSLSNSTGLFLRSKAYTSERRLIESNYNNSSAKFAPMGNNRWRLIIKPQTFYHLGQSEKLDRIDFFITDKNGAISVGQNPSKPFTYLYNYRHATPLK